MRYHVVETVFHGANPNEIRLDSRYHLYKDAYGALLTLLAAYPMTAVICHHLSNNDERWIISSAATGEIVAEVDIVYIG